MFYDNLKAICDKRDIKITNLVSELKISSGNMSRWKKGTVPKGDTLATLATRLDVTVDELVYGKKNKPTTDNGDGPDDDLDKEIMFYAKQLSRERKLFLLEQVKGSVQSKES